MRIAVAGGTGLVGGMTVRALERAGHEPVVISRSTGANTITGDGMDEALQGVEAVVDATSTNELEADATRAFFGTSTKNLLAAEERAGVGHHVVLSIVGVDRIPDNGHYAGKIRQEEVAEAGPVPVTILRATQFFEFGEQAIGWTRDAGLRRHGPPDPRHAWRGHDAHRAELAERHVRRRDGGRGPAARAGCTPGPDDLRRVADR
jgi:uncharacterized protein YbjT (DUF2867 family)